LTKLNLKDIDDNEVLLVVTPTKVLQKINFEILKHFINDKQAVCVYSTFNKPNNTIITQLQKNNIKTDKIFFIDCATPVSSSEEMHGSSKSIFLNPQSLTNLSIAITTALENLPKKQPNILILDTIDTLMLHNDRKIVIRFIHQLCGKIRKNKVKSIFYVTEEESDKKTISEISNFCDTSLSINEI
jgi:archaellum biogenesis ATPase FlaH